MNTPGKSLSDSYSEVFAMEASKDVSGLIEIIKNSQKKLVARKAVLALGRIKSPEAVEPLMELVLKIIFVHRGAQLNTIVHPTLEFHYLEVKIGVAKYPIIGITLKIRYIFTKILK